MTRQSTYKSAAPFVGSDFDDGEFEQIRLLLLERRGFDLGMYKDQCIRRRIASRVRASGMLSAADYLQLLQQREDEIDALLAAVSIHVSQFFRNPRIFALLEAEVLPGLIRRAETRPDRTLKVWSVGCAGGEEPYSLALLLDELAPAGLRVDILGTDISAPVLRQAAGGYFDALRVSEVPEDVLQRYFASEGRGFRVCERIRRQVRFAEHNILSDESQLSADLILCRNVMIYFSRADQDRILERFAATLTPQGVLVLGNAESLIGKAREAFSPLFAAERIYRRR
ncbi:chemotaxis protein CheR [Geothermobacter hydrogeniphilus]|uniref:protein-glutamate O-methyltransferase n=1 Tax=Geothermobacter hydrogeniphilus TaxID=1969733 RepID=A0A2K2HEU3_9BACT|nr:protein-glutamate O-methyltransferase CheR [Geothermobacter hydrogeniphilus]PNU21800.1 chemotaxis protein CheR [Geothermobacter hydrogeniphilus]